MHAKNFVRVGCYRRATHVGMHKRVPMFCSVHKMRGMHSKTFQVRCHEEGCSNYATHGWTWIGKRVACLQCAYPGMKDLRKSGKRQGDDVELADLDNRVASPDRMLIECACNTDSKLCHGRPDSPNYANVAQMYVFHDFCSESRYVDGGRCKAQRITETHDLASARGCEHVMKLIDDFTDKKWILLCFFFFCFQ